MRISRRKLVKYTLAVGGVTLFLILLLGPTWVVPIDPATGEPYANLGPEAAQRSLAVFVLCLSLWVSNLIPLPATSLLAIGLLPLLGVMPHAQAFAYFGNSAVFFMLGIFILSAAMIDTGLSKRLTLLFLHRFDKTPTRLIGGVLVTGSFFSLWMPEHAVAAMMYPLVIEVAQALQLKPHKSVYARSLFLALAWGTIVGGIGTYLGGARAVLAVELYQKFYPEQAPPGFLEYAKMTMPTVVVMTIVGYFVVTVRARPEIDSITQATRMLTVRVRELGPLGGRERRLAGLMVLTIAAWILVPDLSQSWLGYRIGLGVIALIAGIMVFALRISWWNRIQDYVNWGVLIMYGGAVALGYAVADTHAMEWIAANLVPLFKENRFLFVAATAVLTVVLTESISNAAVVTLMLPVVFGLSKPLGVDPLVMMYLVAVPAGMAFCLPMSSPPNAIAFSSGYYSLLDAVQRGVFMTGSALIVFLLCAYLYWPRVGLPW